MNFIAIPPEKVAAIWPEVQDGVANVFKHTLGTVSATEMLQKASSGEWFMFCMFQDGKPIVSFISNIRDGKEGTRIFDVGYCWGAGVDDWIEEVYESFETIARQCDCDSIAFNGRVGWKRLAARFGFSVNSITYVKGLNHGCR